MKSRKLKAVLAAVSALAVLATAMTGFAATTTTYNADADKVSVSATLEATDGKEVTYLVTTGDGADKGVSGTNIVYIDQQTAKGGQVKFDYKIDKDYITSLSTTVIAGSNGEAVNADDLSLTKAPTYAAGTGYKVELFSDVAGQNALVAYGNSESDATVYAKVTATDAENYEVTAIKVNGVVKDDAAVGAVFAVAAADAADITVETKEAEKAPKIEAVIVSGEENDAEYEGKKVNTSMMRVVGAPYEVGVVYGDVRYPAQYGVENGAYVAVRLVTAEGIDVSAIKPYHMTDANTIVYSSAN